MTLVHSYYNSITFHYFHITLQYSMHIFCPFSMRLSPKICIKYRKHGSSSFSHTLIVCASAYLEPKKNFAPENMKKVAQIVPIFFSTAQNGPVCLDS
jgi:hypothetical protein